MVQIRVTRETWNPLAGAALAAFGVTHKPSVSNHALLQRAVEQAHQPPLSPATPSPPLEVSCFHLAVQIRGGYEGLLIALLPEHWPHWNNADPAGLAQHLLRLARNINPRQVAISKRGPKIAKPKGYVDGKTARAHVATTRLLAKAKATP